MSKYTIIIAIFCALPSFLFGQSLDRMAFKIMENGQELKLALAGGMNLPQFSAVDLDNDGTKELFVFDKDGDALSAFKHVSGTDYEFASDLLVNFPRLNKWALMYDYNQDGAADIFAYTTQLGIAGIEVHKGHWVDNKLAFNKLSFGQSFDILYYEGSGSPINLYVSSIDIPAFSDVDSDGDMDILTFASAGGYVQYFKNFSQEQGYGNDTLIFKKADPCWGKFYESGQTTAITLSSDPNACAQAFHGGGGATDRHAGSTVLAMDVDEDGDKDLFLGDISFKNVVLLFNTGTASNAFMTDQDTLFPKNHPIVLPVFPATFAIDVDHDGRDDIISSPNAAGLSATTENVWFYKNTNSVPQFDFTQNDFLVGKMIDLGKGAYPSFADINGDGLLDMVIGNNTFFDETGLIDSRLTYYQNIGTKEQPVFELVAADYLGLKSASIDHWNFTPTFGDLDGDGDLDLMVGEYLGGLYYFENLAGANQPMDFAAPIFPYKDIDVGLVSAPFLVDVDEDGLMDIIIGERNGNVNFIKNIGSAGSPDFNSNHEAPPNNPFWGAVDTRYLGGVTGYSVPRLWKENGVFRLFAGSKKGKIFEYNNIENNLNGPFTKVTEDYGKIKDGGFIYPVFVDLNNDGLRELVIGNWRGGLTAFKTTLPQPVTTSVAYSFVQHLNISPNPSAEKFTPIFGEGQAKGHLSIFNTSGQVCCQNEIVSGEPVLIANLPYGIYFVKVIAQDTLYTSKLIKME